MLLAILTALACLSALLAILAAALKQRLTHYLFKPLTMIFISGIALQAKHPVSSFYRSAILVGLLFSLAGDIFLMLPTDRFIEGLVSFLFAHICYFSAFLHESHGSLSFSVLLPLLIYGGLMLGLLWSRLGKMKMAVLLYLLMILAMGWAAASRWLLTGQEGGQLAMWGAILFISSDSALAFDRFKKQFRGAQSLILTTYFTAQWLIALST